MWKARAGAPQALDYLCAECSEHFAGVRANLDALGIPYEIDPTIVRGLDYYTRTAFEVPHTQVGAQGVMVGGGRYDGLVEELGGQPTPGHRFRLWDRAVAAGPGRAGGGGGVGLVRRGRFSRGTGAGLAAGHGGPPGGADGGVGLQRAQPEDADERGGAARARLTALLGEDEVAQSTVTLRDMTTGEQISVAGGRWWGG